MLGSGGPADEPEEPAIEGELEIAGQKYVALLTPQPLLCDWEWTDDGCQAELYDVILGGLGNGEIRPPMLTRSSSVI